MLHDLPPLDLIDIFWPFLQRLSLTALGAGIFVHLVCAANFMPPGRAPLLIWCPVAGGAAAAVLIVHSAIFDRIALALWASALSAGCLLALQLVLWLRGYHVCAHLSEAGQGGEA